MQVGDRRIYDPLSVYSCSPHGGRHQGSEALLRLSCCKDGLQAPDRLDALTFQVLPGGEAGGAAVFVHHDRGALPPPAHLGHQLGDRERLRHDNRLAQALLRVMLDLRAGIQSWDHSTAQVLADGLDVLGTLVYDHENEVHRRSAVIRLLNSLTQ